MDGGTVVVIVGLLSSPVAIWLLNRYFPSKTPMQQRFDRLDARCKILEDYVHDLREHIADGKPPPPPDWPEQLKRYQ